MGEQQISPLTSQAKRDFLRHLLADINALEQMIHDGLIESGRTRIGAEQECCLIRSNLRPAMTGPKILSVIDDAHFTSELAQWNIEINLDPQDAGKSCLDQMTTQLRELLDHAQRKAAEYDSKIVLTGILPTIRRSELDFKYMTPNPRYRIIDQILKELRGEDFTLYIEGVDEVNMRHDSILFEACNTSFQVHLQVDPAEFADMYNWAQVLAGPVLAPCVNSPILLGKELWSETRIALFRQSIDIRHAGNYISDQQPRVAFGYDWLKHSAAEIFKRDLATYEAIIGSTIDEEDSMGLLQRGQIPRLRAMNLHNGTLYKWNRACYGVSEGIPHLRIENRYIPAGPTIQDEMANAAFWVGLMLAMPDECRGQWDRHFYFQEVRSNFLKAARNGLSNELVWFGKATDAAKLVLDKLLPLAEQGLQKIGVEPTNSRPYLRTIENRARSRQTGADWIIQSLRRLRRELTLDECLLLITQQMVDYGLHGVSVDEWKTPCQSKLFDIPDRYQRVESIMVTRLVTVHEEDLLDFANTLMIWNEFHHLPVVSHQGRLIGLISAKDIEAHRNSGLAHENSIVGDCMTEDIVTITPETSLEKAEKVMQINEVGSLPVVREKQLVGIITANDVQALKRKLDRV
ncbi:MAG TPA: CBS domain-containing protein [Pirellulaceae bacterium]|nr:CBS domain-containing protein [Pirellulaceae bacterium]